MITNDSFRFALAGAVALTYLLFCAWIWRRHRAARASDAPVSDGTPLLIAYASQTGFAEELARRSASLLQSAGVLQSAGRAVRVLPISQLDASLLASSGRSLFVVSTTGEGDPPDSAAVFLRRMMVQPQELAHLRYGLLALGDRSYKHFCAFGRQLDAWLRKSGAKPLFESIEVDNCDGAALLAWQKRLQLFGADGRAWQAPPHSFWQLQERVWLNPGSAGGAAYRIFLTPPKEGNWHWQAGDIAEILPGISGDSASPPNGQSHREYSIASLPQDGGIALLVRRMELPDGRLGLGSGWLTKQAEIGDGIALRIRSNSGFHPPEDARPLILIGNGTGMAGLFAHLKARAAANHKRNWLVFGERSSAHDFFFRSEIEAWLREGVIERLDLAFSRDQTGRIYVQHLLREQAGMLRQWAADGAAIYICGSLQGMAGDVEAALMEILGQDDLQSLRESGRYRRDVY